MISKISRRYTHAASGTRCISFAARSHSANDDYASQLDSVVAVTLDVSFAKNLPRLYRA